MDLSFNSPFYEDSIIRNTRTRRNSIPLAPPTPPTSFHNTSFSTSTPIRRLTNEEIRKRQEFSGVMRELQKTLEERNSKGDSSSRDISLNPYNLRPRGPK